MTMTRRETLKGVALLAVTEKMADGGFAPVSPAAEPLRAAPILPPGALSRGRFRHVCIGCGVCITECPGECLRPSVNLAHLGQPEMDFRTGYCRLTCTKCTAVCPVGALTRLHVEERGLVKLGVARLDSKRCLSATGTEKCRACVRKCPIQAIEILKDGLPVVNETTCVGCGACEHVCPVRPQPAIIIEAFQEQRKVRPMSEEDLLEEMKHLVANGESAVVARAGVIIARKTGRGIGPILDLHDEQKLQGALVVDKVIGRAAAAICVSGGARRVHAALMSEDAMALLKANGIAGSADLIVPLILNHEKTGSCPMEAAVKNLDSASKMVEAVRKAMKR